MDRKGFIDFNTRLSPENSGKADSYARAIMILDEVLPYQNVIDLQGRSLHELSDVAVIDDVLLSSQLKIVEGMKVINHLFEFITERIANYLAISLSQNSFYQKFLYFCKQRKALIVYKGPNIIRRVVKKK